MGYTILVIDTETNQRDLLCATLREKLAYQTVGLADPHEAIQHISVGRLPEPDLVLCDVTRNGSETILPLKNSLPTAPLITMVKYGDYDTAIATLSAGAQDFLTKPMALERMSTTFRNALLLRDARREIARLRGIGASPGAAQTPCHLYGSMLPFSLISEDGNIRRMHELEAEAIRFAMQHYNGRLSEIARRLGIGRSTLYRKLNDLCIRQSQAA